MKVITIAAGKGKRMGKFTENVPKPLVMINGRSIIDRQLSIMKDHKITDIIIITGPHHEKFNLKNITYVNDTDYEKHDALASFMTARDYMDNEILITYADQIFDESIIRQMINFSGDFGIAVDLDWEKNYVDRDQHPKSEADNILFNKERKIIAFQKNLQKSHSIIGEFSGIVKLSKKGSLIFSKKLSELYISHKGKFHGSSSFAQSIMPDMLQELIDSGIEVEPVFVSGKWCEIDTPQDLERARKIFK